MEANTRKTKRVMAVTAVVLVIAFFIIYTATRPDTNKGEKQITIQVIYRDGTANTYQFDTAREYLGQVLEDENLVEGQAGPYGMYITKVDGETAEEGRQEWWCITKEGELVMTSADQTPLADGDVFELALKTGYTQ